MSKKYIFCCIKLLNSEHLLLQHNLVYPDTLYFIFQFILRLRQREDYRFQCLLCRKSHIFLLVYLSQFSGLELTESA